MTWRIWPRKFIQPSGASHSRRHDDDDASIGDTLALGLLFLIGVVALALAGAGREAPFTSKVSAGRVVSDRPTARPFAGAEPRNGRRARLAMAREAR